MIRNRNIHALKSKHVCFIRPDIYFLVRKQLELSVEIVGISLRIHGNRCRIVQKSRRFEYKKSPDLPKKTFTHLYRVSEKGYIQAKCYSIAQMSNILKHTEITIFCPLI